jgi:hypothetical protein
MAKVNVSTTNIRKHSVKLDRPQVLEALREWFSMKAGVAITGPHVTCIASLASDDLISSCTIEITEDFDRLPREAEEATKMPGRAAIWGNDRRVMEHGVDGSPMRRAEDFPGTPLAPPIKN